MVLLWFSSSAGGQTDIPAKIPKFGKVSYTITVKRGGVPAQIMEHVFQWKGKRFREERRGKGMEEIWMIGDGQNVYHYSPKTRMATPQRYITLETLYPGLPSGFAMRKVGEEKLKGLPCDIYAGQSPGERPGRNRCWLTRKEGLMIKSETAGPYGRMTEIMKTLDLKTPPPDSVFRLPAGARVVE